MSERPCHRCLEEQQQYQKRPLVHDTGRLTGRATQPHTSSCSSFMKWFLALFLGFLSFNFTACLCRNYTTAYYCCSLSMVVLPFLFSPFLCFFPPTFLLYIFFLTILLFLHFRNIWFENQFNSHWQEEWRRQCIFSCFYRTESNLLYLVFWYSFIIFFCCECSLPTRLYCSVRKADFSCIFSHYFLRQFLAMSF